MIHYIAFADHAPEMVPVSHSGHLVTFASREAATDAAGVLGVAAAVETSRLPGLCREFGLEMPSLPFRYWCEYCEAWRLNVECWYCGAECEPDNHKLDTGGETWDRGTLEGRSFL